jgi:hypothetical protein
LDRSKALTTAFQQTANTRVSTVIEMVHALHGTQWVYDAAPLCEMLDVLGQVMMLPHPASDVDLTPVMVSQCGPSHFQLFGQHLDNSIAPSAGNLWVCLLSSSPRAVALQMRCSAWHAEACRMLSGTK